MRGLIAGVVVWLGLAKLLGLGAGLPEMLVITAVAIAVCIAVGGIGPSEDSLAQGGQA